MKERPILMSAAMVRASLAGHKTQTRRAMKAHLLRAGASNFIFNGGPKNAAQIRDLCPYGRQGDRLWVRESFAVGSITHAWGHFIYRATFNAALKPTCEGYSKWQPSIHMPRIASRLVLEITGIRFEQLQETSAGDAMEEGYPDELLRSYPPHERGREAKKWYADLWDSINGKGAWEKNPWVWVIEFKKVN